MLQRLANMHSGFDQCGMWLYQNMMEHISIVLASGLLIQQGARNKTVCVIGGNTSSKKCAAPEQCKGNLCTNAASCLIALLASSLLDFVDSVHKSGVYDNEPFQLNLSEMNNPLVTKPDTKSVCNFVIVIQQLTNYRISTYPLYLWRSQ